MQLFKKKEKTESDLEFEKVKTLSRNEQIGYFVTKFLNERNNTKDMSFLFIHNPNQSDVCGIKVPKNKTVDFTFLQDIQDDFGLQSISITEDGCLFIQFPHF